MRALHFVAALFFATAVYSQAIPTQISYQGYLELSGSPVSGAVDLEFSLYTQATGSTAVWTEAQTSVPVDDGVYQVTLGSVTKLPTDTFGVALWLGVRIDGGAELTPRTALLPAPYALSLRLPFEASSSSDGIVIKEAGAPSTTREPFGANHGIEIRGAEGNGVAVGRADALGVYVESAGTHGVYVFESGQNGLRVDNAGENGLRVGNASQNGMYIFNADSNGVYVFRAVGDGVQVAQANQDGLRIDDAGQNGLRVSDAGQDGVFVGRAGTPSTDQADSTPNGFEVGGAEGSGLFVGQADIDGIRVLNAGRDGVRVENASRYGAYVQSTPATTSSTDTEGYVALFENKRTSPSAHGLAIQIGTTGNPDASANFMGFFDGDDDLLGQIEGNNQGGVQYTTTGADYAEYLPVAGCSSSTCGLEAGTVVGVKAGLVSLSTEDADEVLVISTRPAVVGNAPQGESTEGFAAIAMLGQADVRVVGPVEAGDYVIASGRGDGTAVAVPASEIRVDMLERLIGRAWGAKPGAGEGTVNVAVGLDRTEVLADLLQTERDRVTRLEHELADLRQMIEALSVR